MTRLVRPYEETVLWRAVASTLSELDTSGEVKVQTAPDYVVAYICQELVARGVIASDALLPWLPGADAEV